MAVVTEAIWLGSLALTPWKSRVGPFLALFAAAFFVYLAAWLWLRRRPRGALFWIVGGALAFRATVFFAPPSLSDDVYRYLWDGRVQAAGIHPYAYPPEDAALAHLRDGDYEKINHKSIRTIYPPLAQTLFRLGAALRPSITLQKLIFVCFDIATLFLLLWILRRRGQAPERVLAYAWNPLVIVEFAGSGHVDSLAIFFLVAGAAFLEIGRNKNAGVLLGASFLGKLGALPLLPWLVVRREARPALGTFSLAVALGYAAFLSWPMLELKPVFFSGLVDYGRDWYFNASLYALAVHWAPPPAGLWRVVLLGGFALLGLGLSAVFARRQIWLYIGVLWAALLAVSPVVHPWYVAWLAPFLCFYPLWTGFVWTGAAALSYWVWHVHAATGVWALPVWVGALEYGLVGLALIFDLRRFLRQRPRPQSAPAMAPAAGPVRPVIIIPAFNEAAALPAVLAEIPREENARIIVVDNGSTDGTAAAAEAGGARVVPEPRRGYGRAVRAGLAQLPPDCNVVVVMDGDHSDYPADLTALLTPLKSGAADFVIGSRVLGGAPRGSLTPQQRFGNWLACRLMALFFGRRFTDLGPFRALRREALDRLGLTDPTFGWNVEMQIKALRAGLRIVEIPVRYRPRIGVSKISGTLTGAVGAGVVILKTIFQHGFSDETSAPGPF